MKDERFPFEIGNKTVMSTITHVFSIVIVILACAVNKKKNLLNYTKDWEGRNKTVMTIDQMIVYIENTKASRELVSSARLTDSRPLYKNQLLLYIATTNKFLKNIVFSRVSGIADSLSSVLPLLPFGVFNKLISPLKKKHQEY